jgi:hypothetical protein
MFEIEKAAEDRCDLETFEDNLLWDYLRNDLPDMSFVFPIGKFNRAQLEKLAQHVLDANRYLGAKCIDFICLKSVGENYFDVALKVTQFNRSEVIPNAVKIAQVRNAIRVYR